MSVVGTALIATLLVGCAGPPEPKAGVITTKDSARIAEKCMRDLGWDVSIDSSGAVVSGFVPDAQASKYEKDSASCWAKAKPTSIDDLSDATKRLYYKTLLADRQCIIKLGYSLPPAPTFQTWSGESQKWSPYGDIASSLSPGVMSKVLKACPVGLG